MGLGITDVCMIMVLYVHIYNSVWKRSLKDKYNLINVINNQVNGKECTTITREILQLITSSQTGTVANFTALTIWIFCMKYNVYMVKWLSIIYSNWCVCHCDIHSAVSHSGSSVTLAQISYWSPSCTLLLQKGQQPPGSVLYMWALCPFSVLTSTLISSLSSPSFTHLSSPFTSSDLLPSFHFPTHWFTLYSLSAPPPLSFSVHPSLCPLSVHMLSSSLSVPSMRFLSRSKNQGNEWGSQDAR